MMNTWTRLRFLALILADRVLGTNLVNRELDRIQRHIESFEGHARTLQRQMETLTEILHVAQVELCVCYLYQRQLLRPTTWLQFSPAENAQQEKDLDLLIAHLVKYDLASVQTETLTDQTYTYHLHPDWAAITDTLAGWEDRLDPVIAAWLDAMRSDHHG